MIEIHDKRNVAGVTLGELKEGDTFMWNNALWLILRDQDKDREDYKCVHMGRENNGHVSEIFKNLNVQQVSVVVSIHLV